jgi:hypothetical protein
MSSKVITPDADTKGEGDGLVDSLELGSTGSSSASVLLTTEKPLADKPPVPPGRARPTDRTVTYFSSRRRMLRRAASVRYEAMPNGRDASTSLRIEIFLPASFWLTI